MDFMAQLLQSDSSKNAAHTSSFRRRFATCLAAAAVVVLMGMMAVRFLLPDSAEFDATSTEENAHLTASPLHPGQNRSTESLCARVKLVSKNNTQKGFLETPKIVRNTNCTSDLDFSISSRTKSDADVTFCLFHYNRPDLLARQIDSWTSYSPELMQRIHFLIIDDGSRPGHTVSDFLQKQSREMLQSKGMVNLDVYQIEQDLAWNLGGAHNLGALMAPTSWIFFNDCDILVPEDTMEYILKNYDRYHSLKYVLVSRFRRLRPDGVTQKPHPAVMLLSKETYWKVGGSDEDFAGQYGYSDLHFLWSARSSSDVSIIEVSRNRGRTNVIPNLMEMNTTTPQLCPSWMTCLEPFRGPTLSRERTNKELMRQKKQGEIPPSTEFLRFSWHKVENWWEPE